MLDEDATVAVKVTGFCNSTGVAEEASATVGVAFATVRDTLPSAVV